MGVYSLEFFEHSQKKATNLNSLKTVFENVQTYKYFENTYVMDLFEAAISTQVQSGLIALAFQKNCPHVLPTRFFAN